MLKVFLVEDEIVVRRGLRKNIKWEELGLICVGEAADGEIAYAMIQEAKPDILLTDIKMPFMDGLQLSALVKKKMPNIKIIIISGYDDFEYAQKAVGIGVAEFLLKPISSAVITETVLRVRKEIERERQQLEFMERFEFEMQEYEKLKRKQFFREIVGARSQASELLEKGNRLGLSLAAAAYNIVLFQFFQDAKEPDSYTEALIALEQKVESRFKAQSRMILFERDLEGYAVLLQDGSGDSAGSGIEQITDACVKALNETVSNVDGIRFFVAVGLPVKRITELPQCFADVRRLFAQRYLQNASGVRYMKEKICQTPAIEEESAKKQLEGVLVPKIDKNMLERFLKCAADDEIDAFISEHISGAYVGNPESELMMRQYMVMDAFFIASSFVEGVSGNAFSFRKTYGEKSRISQAMESEESLREYLSQLITEAVKTRDAPNAKRYSKILEKVRQFILENYNNDEISLHQAAAIANISPSHFSTIFSQEMGTTFIEYLTNIRMEKAKELLRCSSMKMAEISVQAGYRDPHYFSYLFKKRVGCTPKEYRQSAMSNE